MRLKFIYLITAFFIYSLSFGHQIQDIWLSGEPNPIAIAKVKESGMQHYFAIRNRGKEKLLLWPRSGKFISENNYLSEIVDSTNFFIKGPQKQDLKGELINSDLGWHAEYNFKEEGFSNIFLIIRKSTPDTNYIHIARQERMSHKCRSGHKSVMVKMDPISYSEIAPLEIFRQRQAYENFHGILESGMNISFEVKFKGKPLPNHKVVITTQYNWVLEAYSDENGIVSFQLPIDYYTKIKELDKHKTHRFLIQTYFNEIGNDLKVNHYSTKMEFDYIPAKAIYESYVWPWVIFFITLISLSVALIMVKRKKQKYMY